MQTPITVSELNNQIKSLLESTFLSIVVKGEISRVTYHSSGHLYFTLKDTSSAISCIMFRGNNQKLKFRVEEGMGVVIYGAISVYSPRGSYQINCINLEPLGNGALALAYEQLKKKLEAKGYFAQERKKSIPKFPKTIALVTSKTGAALQDMLRVAKKRWPLVKIILIDALVQGKNASTSIALGIKKAGMLPVDIIVTGRGGGSIEDLWAFNEEIVADAIYLSKIPVVSAVGHEIDFLISDFVADLRAPTPSAAMEMILPDQNEILLYIDNLLENYHSSFKRILLRKNEELKNLYYSYKQNSFLSKIKLYKNEIKISIQRYNEVLNFILQKKEQNIKKIYIDISQKENQLLSKKEQFLSMLLESFKANDPSKKIKNTFAQILKENKPINLENIKKDEIFTLVSTKTKLTAKAIEKSEID